MSAQGFSQELRQRQTQQMVLAPQLRQSLKILQVAALDLRATIQEELQSNPTLEELPMEADGPERTGDENGDGDNGVESTDTREELQFERNFEILNRLDQDWRDHMTQSSANQAYTQEDAERRQHFLDSVVGETSLQEHLLEQARLADLDEQEMAAMRFLIGSLDNNGFLTSTPNDIALLARLPLSTVQRAHAVLKSFEPPGIGCLDLQDSLLQQLVLRGRARSIPARIVKDQFHLLARRRIPEIARKMNLPIEEVQRALAEISQLDPAPGRRFSEDTNRVVVPDVTVENVDGEWTISLTSDYIPKLRLSHAYKDMLAKGTLTREEKEYLQEKMRSGRFLISSIEQRQQTIEKIAREIVNRQKEFFEEGVSKLKPLTMTQVAEVVGVHETTVSRAIANKYMRTPHGVFEMRYFFTSGYESAGGETISNTSVKDMIAQMIANEDPEKPLSDETIAGMLAERDIKIARRTVAKYREELGILQSNLRREYA